MLPVRTEVGAVFSVFRKRGNRLTVQTFEGESDVAVDVAGTRLLL